MSALQGKAYETVVRLAVDSGYGPAPVLGVLATEVSASMRRTGTYAFELKALEVSVWKELGSGYYVIVWTEYDTVSLGELFYTIESDGGPAFDRVEGRFEVSPVPLTVLAGSTKCVLSGNITDLGGEPGVESTISFRIAKTPSATAGSIIEGKILRTVPDAFGNFSVTLLRGKKVIVEIPQAGLRHTITVPHQQTANLVDVLPPIID